MTFSLPSTSCLRKLPSIENPTKKLKMSYFTFLNLKSHRGELFSMITITSSAIFQFSQSLQNLNSRQESSNVMISGSYVDWKLTIAWVPTTPEHNDTICWKRKSNCAARTKRTLTFFSSGSCFLDWPFSGRLASDNPKSRESRFYSSSLKVKFQ